MIKRYLKELFVVALALMPMFLMLEYVFHINLYRDYGLLGILGFPFCMAFYGSTMAFFMPRISKD